MSGSPGATREPGQARLLSESLDGFDGGPRWALWALPPSACPPAGALLVVQALLDEQALSRRMLVHALRGLAGAGWTALVIDPLGTGDSAGLHDEASLARWQADLGTAASMLRARAASGPLALLGVRMGALLAIDLAGRLAEAPAGLVLWNPPATGAALIDPLRRLERLASGRAGENAPGPMRLAGWPVQADLVEALRGLRLDAAPAAGAPGARLAIVQTQRMLAPAASHGPAASPGLPASSEPPAPPAPPLAIAAALPAWQRAGWSARIDVLAGEPWWSAMDACDPRPLAQRTLAALDGLRAGTAPARAATTGSDTADRTSPPTDASPPIRTALPRFEPVVIPGSQGDLAGAYAPGLGAATAAVLIIPGQPQTRVGAHRMFVTLAAGLHERGIASLRLDIGGWGDSPGTARPFEAAHADIVAAATALRSRMPDTPLWLYGLCDGASALTLALPALRRAGLRPRGVCLLNPWVRSEATLARAMVSGYYARRLADPAFWGRLARGRIPWRNLVADPIRFVVARLGRAAPASGRAGEASGRAGASLPEVLIERLGAFEGEVLTLLSGADLTAAETEALIGGDPRWRTRLVRPDRLLRLQDADHSLSDPAHERAAIDWLATRIAELAPTR